MKRFCTGFKFFLMLGLVVSVFSLQAQQTIWGGAGDDNGEFNGGLNDWIAVGVSSAVPAQAANVLWIWDEDGVDDMGSFGGGAAMQSASVGNGVALFASDFLDNGGTATPTFLDPLGTGTGPATAPTGGNGVRVGHRGELISPMIDCSGVTSVALSFNTYKRHLTNTNGNTTTYVGISNDDGQTWVEMEVQPESIVNEATDPSTRLVFNITDLAAGENDVRIKFIFDGYYYFWMIDDVSMTTLSLNDLAIHRDSVFYSPQSFETPVCQFQTDTLVHTTVINNVGGSAQTNVVYKGEILNEINEVLFSDSLILDMLPAGVDTSVTLPSTFAPGLLNLGRYFMRYSTYSLDNADFNPSDNVAVVSFIITESTYAKEDDQTIGFRPGGGGDYAAGNVYRTSSACQESFVVTSVDFGVAVDEVNDGPLAGKNSRMLFHEG